MLKLFTVLLACMKIRGDIDWHWLEVLSPLMLHFVLVFLRTMFLTQPRPVVSNNRPVDIAAHNAKALGIIAGDNQPFVSIE